MSSILTNTSSMVALKTLQGINRDLAKTQDMISSGKKVSSAQDNAAVWAISKVMESDVQGFKSIQDSIGLGLSTTGVARNAAETVSDLLTEMKDRIVAAQEDNVDRTKIQAEVAELRDQISSVVGAAQFNGLNMLSNVDNEVGSGTVSVLASLDRSSDQSVSSRDITVTKQDLGTAAAVFGTTAATAGDLMTDSSGDQAGAMAISGGTETVNFTAGSAVAGNSFRITLTGAAGNELGTTAINFDYVARDGDTEADVSQALFDKINNYITDNELTNTTVARNATTGALTLTNNDGTAGNVIAVALAEFTGGNAAGGLEALGNIDVSTAEGAASALNEIEGLIQTAIDAAAAFGSSQKRLEIQNDFLSNITSSLKAGIGSLVDTNMEEASARLQALQVQQQLGIQALSIANQAPQSILSLFR